MLNVPTLAQLQAEGKKAEVVFWVGCAGSFDDRAKKITKAFVKILIKLKLPLLFWEQKKAVLEIQQSEQEMNFYFKCKHFKTFDT